MSEKCLERIQVNMPESLHRDVLIEAADRDVAAGAFIRHVLEQYLYGHRRSRVAGSSNEEHRDGR